MRDSGAGAKRFLVIENEPAIREVCLRVLTREGFDVVAISGEVARDMLEEKEYDLYLIDIGRLAVSGKELYRFINEKHPRLIDRVIFTSGDVMSGDTQSFLEQTARPFLLKPFAPEQLKTIVRQTLWQIENEYQTRKNTDS